MNVADFSVPLVHVRHHHRRWWIGFQRRSWARGKARPGKLDGGFLLVRFPRLAHFPSLLEAHLGQIAN
jgi:hypothetical protein